MARDFYSMAQPHCYACIQWDGVREYDHDKKQVKVDAGSEGFCRICKKQMRGSMHCPQFFPLR